MNFFKKIFSSNKEENNHNKSSQEQTGIKEIFTDEYFAKRYNEINIDNEKNIVEGCFKMIESYYLDNKIERNDQNTINHPANLDQIVENGMGFHLYCKSFNQEDSQIIFMLAYAFAEFLIKNNNFKFYKDSEPEFPMRSMTLKLDINGAVLSLYPFEYALKVLNNESKFESLHDKIKDQTQNMPNMKDDFMNNLKEKINN
ncbi:hypothetical protein [Flavobacterium sp.]|uniref:hypothetical protein n=1 Tax=Flavobacterium sp. TaxID=239 RepID=UPI00375166A2